MMLNRFINPIAAIKCATPLLALFLLLTSLQLKAGREKMNSRSTTIQAGTIVQAKDNKYPNVYVGSTVSSLTGKITLALDNRVEYVNYYQSPSFYVKVGVKIMYIDASNGNLTTMTRDLIIDHYPSGHTQDKQYVVIKNTYAVAAEILYVLDASNNPPAFMPSNLYLEAEVETERYYTMSQTTVLTANHNYLPSSGELEVYWNGLIGAEEYELEYTFVNDIASTSVAYDYNAGSNAVTNGVPVGSLEFSFNNNSTKVRTKWNNYKISLNYERGVLFYRVRPIGRSLSNPALDLIGMWSLDQPQTSLTLVLPPGFNDYYQISTGHEENKNWQMSTTFAEDGKKKDVISYFDGSFRNRQSVTRNSSTNVSIFAQTIYDSHGRPAINVLPSPSKYYDSKLDYFENLNRSTNQTLGPMQFLPFSKLDFEMQTGSNTCPLPADPMLADDAGASTYYSSSNSDQSGPNAFLPDAKGYPFTQTMYTPDNTGRVRSQSGLGPDHKIGSGHETKYLYGDASQSDLDKLFGSEAGYWQNYKRNTVSDPNGQISVSYLNSNDQVIATALAGAPPQNVNTLSSVNLVTKNEKFFSETDGNYTTVNQAANGTITFKKKIIPDITDNYQFSYNLTAANFTDACLPLGVCYDCVYTLEVRITDECGGLVYTTGTSTVGNLNPVDFTCGSPVQVAIAGPSFLVNLQANTEYMLTKVLTIDNKAYGEYLSHFLSNAANSQTCIKTLTDFINEEEVDFSGCNMSCDSCEARVNRYYSHHNDINKTNPVHVSYDPDYVYMSAAQRDKAVRKCRKPCTQITLCDAQFEMMLQDMRPGGQYAEYSVKSNGTYTANMHELSIFNDNNFLRITTLYASSTTAGNGTPFKTYDISAMSHWRNPEYYNVDAGDFVSPDGTSSMRFHYYDEDGEISKIRLVDMGGGIYSPAVLNNGVAYIFSDNFGAWTYPENLANLKDFIRAYGTHPSWAYSMVKNHPEINYYLDCHRQSDPAYGFNNSAISDANYTSAEFDEDLRLVRTFAEANGGSGLNVGNCRWPTIYVANGANNSPTDLISGDPFFKSSGPGSAFKTEFQSRLDYYLLISGSTYISIKEVAAIMYSTGNMHYLTGCQAQFGAPSLNCGTAYAIPTEALDGMWNAYRDLYLALKQKFIMEKSHLLAANPGGSVLRNSWYNGAIGNPNFNATEAYLKYQFNRHLVLNFSHPVYAAIAQWIMIVPGLWPNYPLPMFGIPNNLVYNPPWGQGSFDFGCPSSIYHKARYAKKTKRFHDEGSLINSLGNGAIDPEEVVKNLTENGEASTYLQTGQCPSYKRLETFLSRMAKKGDLFDFGVMKPLVIEGSFTKDIYDAVIACGGLSAANWHPLALQSTQSGNVVTIKFYDISGAVPQALSSSCDIVLTNNTGIVISQWNDVTMFQNIHANGTSGGTNNFVITGFYNQGTYFEPILFNGTTCLSSSCPTLASLVGNDVCKPTEQAFAIQDFLSAVVDDNTNGVTMPLNLGAFAQNNAASYFIPLVQYPFTNGVPSPPTALVSHSATIVSNLNIDIEGNNGSGVPVKVRFAFSQPGSANLSNAIGFTNITPAAIGNTGYHFTIKAHYGAATPPETFTVVVTYSLNGSQYACDMSPNSSCQAYSFRTCDPYVPVQCQNNPQFLTLLKLPKLLTEIVHSQQYVGLPVVGFANYDNLIKSQVGPASTVAVVNAETFTRTATSGNVYDHTVTIGFSTYTNNGFVVDNPNTCVITLTLSDNYDGSIFPSTLVNWTVHDIEVSSTSTGNFRAYVTDLNGGFYVYGNAPCLRLSMCDLCQEDTLIFSEDFESYSPTSVIFNFTTERYDVMAVPIPGACAYAGFNSPIWDSPTPPNISNWGDWSLQNGVAMGLGANPIILGDHTPGTATDKYITSIINNPNNCVGLSPPSDFYVIPWQNVFPITTIVGKRYDLNIHYYYQHDENNYEIQLIADNGTTETVIGSQVIHLTNSVTNPMMYNSQWASLTGSYFATTNATKFKVKVIPTYDIGQCSGPMNTEMYNFFALDDISIRQKMCEQNNIADVPFDAVGDSIEHDCAKQMLDLQLTNAKQRYDLYIDNVKKDFKERYTKACYKTAESMNATYKSSEGHYTLYYYDQAGNLIKTVPPEGVEEINLSALDPVSGKTYATMIEEDRTNNTQTVFTKHRMATRYEYNSLNQLIRQQMPDHTTMDLFGTSVVSSLPAATQVEAMDFSDANHGYLVGNDGGGTPNPVLFITGDGGQTWNPASAVSAVDIIDIDYLNDTQQPITAWAILSNGSLLYSSGSSNYSYGSSNPSWQIINPITGSGSMQFTDIEFPYGLVGGVITGRNGLMLATTDHGATWSTINLNTQNDLNKVDFKSVGSNWWGVAVGNNGTVYYTQMANSFSFWLPFTGLSSNIDVQNVQIVQPGSSTMDIIVTGVDKSQSPHKGVVLLIQNINGVSPSVTNLYTHPSPSGYSSRIDALSLNIYPSGSSFCSDIVFGGYETSAFGTTPIIKKMRCISSTPGLGTYNNVPLTIGSTPPLTHIKDLVVDNPGNSSAIVKGVSGNGKFFTVSTISSVETVSPYDIVTTAGTNLAECNRITVDPTTSTEGHIAGAVGSLFAYNATPSFKSQSTILPPALRAISAAKDGSGRVFAVGDNNAMMTSADFGSTWELTTISGNTAGTNIYAVQYVASDNVNSNERLIMAGNNGFIGEMPVANATLNPAPVSPVGTATTANTYHSISTPINGSSPVFIVGDDGSNNSVIKTYAVSANTPGSVTGKVASGSYTKQGLKKIRFGNNGVVYAVGNGGTILHSTDNGLSFASRNSTSSNALYDAIISDQQNAYAFGSNNTILKTTDAGQNWLSKNSQTSNIKAVYSFGTGQILAAGAGTSNMFNILDESGNFASRFFYDKLGRLIISQNAKQAAQTTKAYSYTIYDALGRITKVGEISGNPPGLADPASIASAINAVIDPATYASWLGNGTKSQVTTTYYDEPASAPCGFVQENLRKRVSATYVDDDDNLSAYQHATFYTYDVHGNVKSLLQHNPEMPSGCKKIDYSYDLLSGKVNKVSYQAGEPDAFYHKYQYDADNRLTNVWTSKDNVEWQQDAKYFYYAHGPLARTEIGHDKVQGIDYAYTIQGWLKGINSLKMAEDQDIGKDGLKFGWYNGHYKMHDFVTHDAAAYTLHYYADNSTAANDYFPILWSATSATGRFEGDVSSLAFFNTNSNSLYNGNISAMATNIYTASPSSSSPSALLSTYRYDQLNRLNLVESNDNFANNSWTGSPGGSVYRNEFSYDANGNIETQHTFDQNGTQTDGMTYRYQTDVTGKKLSNRLYHVNDAVVSTVANYDIDDQGSFTGAPALSNNYKYDEIGNLIKDVQEDIAQIDWNVYGKITAITRLSTSGQNLTFRYDASGNRIKKTMVRNNGSTNPSDFFTTYYVRDAQGNVMATYSHQRDINGPSNGTPTLSLLEHPVYGSSRIGLRNYPDWNNLATMYATNASTYQAGLKAGQMSYELSNHLGNVLTVVSDRKLPIPDQSFQLAVDHFDAEILSSTDYRAFGSPMPGRKFTSSGTYRYGFNGKENDNEVKGSGNSVDFGSRIYDSRLGRWLSVDPLKSKFPEWSPYNFATCNPVYFVDPDGRDVTPAQDFINSAYHKTYMNLLSSNSVFQNLHKKVDANHGIDLWLYSRAPQGHEEAYAWTARGGVSGTLCRPGTSEYNPNYSDKNDLFNASTLIHEFIHADAFSHPTNQYLGHIVPGFRQKVLQGLREYVKDNKLQGITEQNLTDLSYTGLEETPDFYKFVGVVLDKDGQVDWSKNDYKVDENGFVTYNQKHREWKQRVEKLSTDPKYNLPSTESQGQTGTGTSGGGTDASSGTQGTTKDED